MSLAWNTKLLWMPQTLKNHEEIERYSRISYTKSIQQKILVNQNRLLGRPGCPSILSRSTIQETLQTWESFKIYNPWISSMKGLQSGSREWWTSKRRGRSERQLNSQQEQSRISGSHWSKTKLNTALSQMPVRGLLPAGPLPSLTLSEGLRPLVVIAWGTIPSPNWYLYLYQVIQISV